MRPSPMMTATPRATNVSEMNEMRLVAFLMILKVLRERDRKG